MIPIKSDAVAIENNIPAEATGQFTVDEQSLTKIMGVLTNLYTDPEGAVVREYLTNALDAQIEAQEKDPSYVWRPIEVTTPSRFNRNYIVRDFGIGMSADDIQDIYSKYGKSTKETSNAVTGMLGLGSKCALTYTGQFTITGYKNGVRTRAIISKNEDNIPIFQIVDTRATDEPNGVEISVPVRDQNSFQQKTADFLRWWSDGQVLVDGREPEKHGYPLVSQEPVEFVVNGNKVKETAYIYAIDNGEYGYYRSAPRSYVVMGNVPYLVSTDYIASDLTSAGIGFAAYVPMGSVAFPPSREELTYTATTKKTIKSLSEGLFENIYNKAVEDIQNADSLHEAWVLFNSLPNHFKQPAIRNGLSYDGHNLNVSRVQVNHKRLSWKYNGNAQINDYKWADLGGYMDAKGTLIITGFNDSVKFTAFFKKKILYKVNELGGDSYNSIAILVDDDIDEPFLAHVPRVSAEDIKNIKLPKSQSAGPREEVPYEFYYYNPNDPNAYSKVTKGSEVEVDIAGKTVVYVSPQDYRETYRHRGTNPYNICHVLGEDYVLVTLGKNRFEKFLRSHPEAVTLASVLKERSDTMLSNIKDEEGMIEALDAVEEEFLAEVNLSEILDPDLKSLATIVQAKKSKKVNHLEEARKIWEIARRCSITMPYPEPPAAVLDDNPAKRYPLIEEVGSRRMEHLVIYVNAVWEQMYKK